MGNIESEEEETLPELKKMKLIDDKRLYKVYESNDNNKYDFWFLKSSDNTFTEEIKIAQEIQKGNLSGIAKILNIKLNQREKLFTKYYCLNILTEHPLYTLKEYLQIKTKNQGLTPKQITDLFVSITNAQYMLGSKKQYLGFDNIYTSDGTIWKIKPFIQSISFYQELLQYKSKNLMTFEMSGFPSPEEFHQSKCDTDRVQIFGLGMLLLELITKLKSKDIYQKFQINESTLQQRITFLQAQKQNYRGKLIELVIDTLDLDLVRRPNYNQLQRYLNSPESNIDSNLIDCNVQTLDQRKSINLNSLYPPDSQYIDQNIVQQFSKIEQLLNSKINDHRIKNSTQSKQPKLNLVTEDFNYYCAQINGKYHGQGKQYTKTNILVYDGDFFEGEYHNFGTLKYLNTVILKENFNYQDCTNIDKYAICYEGSFQHGIKHGEGRLTLSNGEVFAGSFVNNVVDGYGAFQPKNRQKIIGIWRNGIFQSNNSNIQSFQSQNYQNDRVYEDLNQSESKRYQQLESQGLYNSQNQINLSEINDINLQKLYYDDQKTLIKYVGEMNQGKKNGQGKQYFIDGKLQYVGDFQNDLYCGYGTLYNENPVFDYQINYLLLGDVQTKGLWDHYEGTFQNGLKNGLGTWYLTNNCEFQGFFDNDLPHGEGVLRSANHQEIRAEWKYGQLQGKQ